MVITPIQNIVTSAITQKSSISSGNVSAPAVENNAPVNAALVHNVSGKFIATSALYNTSIDLAGLSSQFEVAQSGTQQIAAILQNLQNIAKAIASGGSGSSVNDLINQFQDLYAQIDQIVTTSSFGGNNLLDGSLTLDNASLGLPSDSNNNATIVPNLGTSSLFTSPPDVTSQGGANNAVAQIADALGLVSGVNDTLENINSQIEFARASVETAQANNFASTAVINNSDINSAGFVSLATGLLNKPSTSASTQTSKLSDLLKLISA